MYKNKKEYVASGLIVLSSMIILVLGVLFIFNTNFKSEMEAMYPMEIEKVQNRSVDEIVPEEEIEEMESIPLKLAGEASYYDYVLNSGWSSVGHYVCATRDFERYSYVLVTNLDNGKTVECKITDFGPSFDIFPERIIDLSSASFSAIADLRLGVLKNVTVEQL